MHDKIKKYKAITNGILLLQFFIFNIIYYFAKPHEAENATDVLIVLVLYFFSVIISALVFGYLSKDNNTNKVNEKIINILPIIFLVGINLPLFIFSIIQIVK